MRLSTEGLERSTPLRKESNLPFIFIVGFVFLLFLGGYLYNKGKLHELYLTTKEIFIDLNLDEKKEYLHILYSKKDFSKATKVLKEIISLHIEDNEQNKELEKKYTETEAKVMANKLAKEYYHLVVPLIANFQEEFYLYFQHFLLLVLNLLT